jgi:hypothetical protein
MKNYSLQPSDENAVKLLRENSIGRNKHLLKCIKLLNCLDDCCTIAVNGEWGSGKTFFVKQAKTILDAGNPQTEMDEDTRNTIQRLLASYDLEAGCYATLYYDAWLHDNEDDPILSLMYAAISDGQSSYSAPKEHSILKIAGDVAGALSGKDFSSLFNEIQGSDALSAPKKSSDVHSMVKEFIKELVDEHGNRLAIFVDELDRCKPDYAIRFLERIKHYFEDERVTFIFSVNLSQLQCTVKSYYGSEFDAIRYLDKFFDLRVGLPSVNIEQFIRDRMNFDNHTLFEGVCIETVRYFRFSLRETERYIRLIKIAIHSSIHKLAPGFSEQNGWVFIATYIAPVMIGLQMADMDAYARFLSGSDSGPLLDILKSPGVKLSNQLILGYGERYDDKTHTITSGSGNESASLTIDDRLEKIYHTIFTPGILSDLSECQIGGMSFCERNRRELEEIVSLLSPDADYAFE